LLPADQQIADGVDLIPLPGHTPGHVGLHISSGGDELLYITDAIHQPHIQLGQPQWHVAFDVAPDEAAVTRRRILQQAADNRTLIAGAHLPFPGLGHVEAVGEGFRLHPVIWQWSA
jgi:glyoxylase-like metal-dependent hydrolase (beta-lactamase superfamily II)